MKLRIAAAALGVALTGATLLAGPAGAAMAGPQAGSLPSVATSTDIQMKVNGTQTTNGTVSFDQQPTVALTFDTGNDGSVPISGVFTVFAANAQGTVIDTVCDNVPLEGFAQGACAVPAGNLPVGLSKIFAQYDGDSDNSASDSPGVTLVVTAEPTSTSLAVVSTVAYGSESAEKFTVTPTPRTSGTPTGEFTVSSLDGTTTFCDRSLAGGVGSCELPDTRLAPGSYEFVAKYFGGSPFFGSNSDPENVLVVPGTARTTLSLSPSSIGFGQQQTEQMTVKVTPADQGDPTGTVTVDVGGTTLCTEPVGAGTATCNLGVDQLPIGSYQVTASYSGDTNFNSSTSPQQALTVTGKSVAAASLSLSKATATFGQEQAVSVTAKVSGKGSSVTPTGTVTIKAGAVSLCTFNLASGQGSCKLGAAKLRPGSYHLTASYGGDVTFGSAASGAQTLTVAAAPTVSALTLSKAKVQAGHEQAERLSVGVKPRAKSALTPAGKVTVKAGSATICVITLAKGKGSCTLTASQLRPGAYHLTGAYAGASPFARSTSPKKTLTVTK